MNNRKYDEFVNKDVWGYAFEPSSKCDSFLLNQPPVLGTIKDRKFYEYNKKGKIKKSSAVFAYNRYYALTEDEAKEGYNKLIDNHIRWMQNMIKKYQESKI